MKFTKKKLKSKHFRYLSARYVTHPDAFLKEVVLQWGINWTGYFSYFINSSLYPPMRMRSLADFNYGFILLHMAQMTEIAYVILAKCQIRPTAKEELFQHRVKETFEAELQDQVIFPTMLLSDFCGYKTLEGWYKVFEALLLARDITDVREATESFDLEYVPIRELLVKLPLALRQIYDRGGIERLCEEGGHVQQF